VDLLFAKAAESGIIPHTRSSLFLEP
jgi:hypothetical protein